MAYESTMEKGRKFQNHQEGMNFDRVRREQTEGKSKGEAKHSAKSDEADKNDSDDTPIHEIVAEHGPAKATRIEKESDDESDKDEEKYSVHSEHEDGHKHTSKGHSLHDAHKHSMEAHGQMPGENEEEDENPESMVGMGNSAPPGMPAVS